MLPSVPRNRRLLVRLAPVAWAMLALVLAGDVATACPSCKTALASEHGGQGDIVSGFMWSILFMLSMPFSLVIGFSTYMYVLVRRARADQAQPRALGANASAPGNATAAETGQDLATR